MMSVLSKRFGTGISGVRAVDAKELQRSGAVVVDGRERSEGDAGLPMVDRRGTKGSLR